MKCLFQRVELNRRWAPGLRGIIRVASHTRRERRHPAESQAFQSVKGVPVRESELVSAVQGDYAGSEVEIFDAFQTRLLQHRLQRFLVGMHAY